MHQNSFDNTIVNLSNGIRMSKKIEKHNTFHDFSSRYVPLINQYIDSFYNNKELSAKNHELKIAYRLLQEYCTREGKRIRPLLLLLAFAGYGGLVKKINAMIPVASSLECMHAFLLIQDDIIDGAVVRRGKPAFHILCDSSYYQYNANIGTWVAIVLADVVMSNALEMIATLEGSSIKYFLNEFAVMYERTALGQLLDIIWSHPEKISDDDIAEMIAAMKTAHYTVSGPLKLGYILAGGNDSDELQRLTEMGYSLGFAFQMRDDIIGVFGDEKDMGKSASSDIAEGKYTVLVQQAWSKLNEKDRTHCLDLLRKDKKTIGEIDTIKHYITKSGAVTVLQDIIDEHLKKVHAILPQLQCNDFMKQCMLQFIDGLFQ